MAELQEESTTLQRCARDPVEDSLCEKVHACAWVYGVLCIYTQTLDREMEAIAFSGVSGIIGLHAQLPGALREVHQGFYSGMSGDVQHCRGTRLSLFIWK